MEKYIAKSPGNSDNEAATFEAGYKRRLQISVGAHRSCKCVGAVHGKSLRERKSK